MKELFQRIGLWLSFGAGLGFVAVWIGIWTFGTLAFDVALARSFYFQLRALSFPTTEGTIIASRVEEHYDGEGSSYTAKIDYQYTVARQEHVGHRLQYQLSSLAPGEAHRIVAQHPPGSTVRVYYNPRNPADALLQPGLGASYALIVLFTMPFNIIMLGCWTAVGRHLRGTKGRLPWNVVARSTPEGLMLHIYRQSPLVSAAGAVLGISFLGVFAVAFGSLAAPQGVLVTLAWIAVFVGAVWVFRWQVRRARVLAIDEFRGTVTLRQCDDPMQAKPTPRTELQAVKLRKKTERDSDGDEKHTFSVELTRQLPGDEPDSLCLATGWTEQQAESFGEWLSDRLKLPLLPARA